MDWEHVAEVTDLEGWSPLPENGFGAVIAAAAGCTLVGRRRSDLTTCTTRVMLQRRRRVRWWTEPRTVADQQTVDESVDEYLAEAGVPARPTGYDWFLRLPPGWDPRQDLVDVIERRINASGAVLPSDVLRDAEAAVESVFDR